MATAEELLMQTTSTKEATDSIEVLTVDLNTRVISIPTTLRVLGVESDDDVKRLHFSLPRYYGEVDLSEFKANINFENARGGGDLYPADDLAVVGDNIEFSWLVDRSAFTYPGDVNFSLCLKKYDANGIVVKEFNTTFATLPVLKGLETSKEVVESNPSAFDVVLFRLYAVEAATGLGRDGYYTIAKVEEYAHGVKLTIIDKDGTAIATIEHGIDGYTPIKGVDYWTNEDKAEIKTYAEKRIVDWAPKTVPVILTTDKWINNRQTVEVIGVSDDNIVVVSPEPSYDNYIAYANHCIRCVEQTDNSLTFECIFVPNNNVTVNVAIYYSTSTQLDSGINVMDDGMGNVIII